MQKLWQYREAEEYILNVPRFTSKNKPQDTKAFWEFLGCPGNHQKIIHIAGTNGKGSVCSYLNALLQETGHSVGMFISPHLVRMTERIQVNRIPVLEEKFTEAFTEVYDAVKRAAETEKLSGYHPTFFEFLFFIGMILFEKEGTDYIILETGLGGRLDATNCIPHPVLTVLTRIGLDHMEYLGDTVEKIAGEKAGIIKEGVPVVTLDVPGEAFAVIQKRAEEKNAPFYPVGEGDAIDCSFHKKSIDFSYQSRYYGYVRLMLSTGAVYQTENAALALRAAEVLLGNRMTAGQMEAAMQSAVWEGRMEEVLPDVFVDGAHNEDGIAAFLKTVRQMRSLAGTTRFYLLFSAVKDKNYAAMLQEIAEEGLFEEVALASLQNSRAAESKEFEKLAQQYGLRCSCYASVEDALCSLLQKKQEGELVFAAGSLYLVGQIKEWLEAKR